jgi:DNA-binding response OmpR family regulator
MLGHLGFTVLQAPGGVEALSAMKQSSVPLQAAMIDLTMPGMSGEEVVREIRWVQDRLPVLVMSGYNELDMQSRFMGRQHTEFLQKPFTLTALHAKMRALLGDLAQS